MSIRQNEFENLNEAIEWWSLHEGLSIPLQIQIAKECIPLCRSEECQTYFRTLQLQLQVRYAAMPLSVRLYLDLKMLWKVRPYLVISASISVGYMMIKGGIHVGKMFL